MKRGALNPGLMRRLILFAILVSGVLYAPLPLIAQNGGGQTPLIPVADMPNAGGGATAPSEPPLEVDPSEAPELVPPEQVNTGGGTAPPADPEPVAPAEPTEPEPEVQAQTALAPEATPPVAAAPAQAPEEPLEPEPEQPTSPPTVPDDDEPDEEEFEEEFDEDFDEVPEAGEPDAAPQVTATGRQLPRTGADLPAVLLSGLALTASGMSLRALCRGRA